MTGGETTRSFLERDHQLSLLKFHLNRTLSRLAGIAVESLQVADLIGPGSQCTQDQTRSREDGLVRLEKRRVKPAETKQSQAYERAKQVWRHVRSLHPMKPVQVGSRTRTE